jgi:hypothetical protein
MIHKYIHIYAYIHAYIQDGELVQWYFESDGVVKKRSQERTQAFALMDEFCGKNGSSNNSQPVALIVTWKPGKDRNNEFVQCRVLDRKRLETVISGAKSNKLTGILQKYVSSAQNPDDEEMVLQCLWSPYSCTIESVPEQLLECFTETHKPTRLLPDHKTIRTRMQVRAIVCVCSSICQYILNVLH